MFEALKRTWRNPKQRPWLIAGGVIAAAAAFMALRRPADDAAVEESMAAVEESMAPVAYEPAMAGAPAYIPIGGGAGYVDTPPADGFGETDFSPLFDYIDQLGAEFSAQLSAQQAEAGQMFEDLSQVTQARLDRQRERIARQRKQNQRQRKRIKRLEQRVKRFGRGGKGRRDRGPGRQQRQRAAQRRRQRRRQARR